MALKETGRFFAEMVEVADEPSSCGCGCLGWIIVIGVVLTILYWIAKFLFAYGGLIIGGIIILAFIFIAFKLLK